jgi:hypothetical protein
VSLDPVGKGPKLYLTLHPSLLGSQWSLRSNLVRWLTEANRPGLRSSFFLCVFALSVDGVVCQTSLYQQCGWAPGPSASTTQAAGGCGAPSLQMLNCAQSHGGLTSSRLLERMAGL